MQMRMVLIFILTIWTNFYLLTPRIALKISPRHDTVDSVFLMG